MLLASALFATSVSSSLDLAYAARYYFQGSRKSYAQIYLCNHRGTGHRQITKNEFNSYAPLWIDRWRLTYVEGYKQVQSKVPSEGWRDKCRVIVYDVRTGERKKIGELGEVYTFYGIWSQGNVLETYDRGPDSLLNKKSFKVTLRGVQKVMNAEDRDLDEFGEEAQDSGGTLFGNRTASIKTKTHPWNLSWTASDVIHNEEEQRVLQSRVHLKSTWKGRVSAFELHGNHLSGGFVTSDGTPILLSSYKYDKYRQDAFLYKLSKDFRMCKLVSFKVGSIQVNRYQPIWFGCQVGRKEGAMDRLKDGRSVYVNWLYTGNYQTGEQWTVAKGLVEVQDFQLRPKE